MNKTFNDFIQQIISKIDGSETEKEDIYEELMIHLTLTYEQLLEEGYTEKQAEKLTIEKFGDFNDIGHQMQEAMFPFRKQMVTLLAIISLLYTFVTYGMQLFIDGDAYIGWLLFSVITSTILLFIGLQVFPTLNRKIWLNTIFLLHSFVYLYGSFLSSSLTNVFATILYICSWIIILFTIFLIYRATIFDFSYQKKRMSKHVKFFHAFNISIGIIATGISLFFLWAFLLFAETFEIGYLTFVIPILIWIIAYIVQIKLVVKNKLKIAYTVLLLLVLFNIAIIVLLFRP